MPENTLPSIIVSGLSGGSGKTMVSLGLSRAFNQQGYRIKSFKKGPDYIDAAWLALAAKSTSGNLDLFFNTPDEIISLFHKGTVGYNFSLIEGNRGLFDGMDSLGSCSTSSLAKVLKMPIVLVLDCTKMTRTAAAIVHGCSTFEQGVCIGGVILNRVGTKRQELLIRESLNGIAPVFGSLPRRVDPFIQERHMGLQCIADNEAAEKEIQNISSFVSDHVDINAIHNLATQFQNDLLPNKEPALSSNDCSITLSLKSSTNALQQHSEKTIHKQKPTIGYVYDAALWFYYHENLQELSATGANLIPVSLLSNEKWPKLDGLYIGGGLPELHAKGLSNNTERRKNIYTMAQNGLPIYAECGGLMYLSESLILDQNEYQMAGVFPYAINFGKKPTGLGYIEATVVEENPFHPLGSSFRGHEFHFSFCNNSQATESSVLELKRGKGIGSTKEGKGRDGLLFQNTFASYMHIFAPAVPHWASAFIKTCSSPC